MTLELEATYAERAMAELRKQRQRGLFFLSSHIFGDPAWELVLEAYIAASRNECVTLADLGNNLRRPVAIVTRLAMILEAEGYVERCRSHQSRDMRCIQLTVDAAARCEHCLDFESDNGDFQNN